MRASDCRSVGTLPMIWLCSAMDDGDASTDGTELQGMEKHDWNTRMAGTRLRKTVPPA